MSEVKSFPFPVLSPDNIDYTEDIKYTASTKKMSNGNAVCVRHHLVGDSLISRALCNGEAVFACVVSLPSTMYRCIAISDSNELEQRQEIDYSDSGYGSEISAAESPMFRPIILAKSRITESSGAGLSSLWSNKPIEIPDGAIIAYNDWERFEGDEGGLLIVEKDNELPEGAMRVEGDTEGGFRFHVKVGGDTFFDKLKEGISFHRRSILTHALSAAFQILNKSHKESWHEYINLRLVANKLSRENAGHWEDDDFSPELAATILYPHEFATDEGVDDND